MRLSLNKFIVPIVDANMILVAQIDQTVISPPSIRMNDTFKLTTPPDNGLKRLSGTLRDDFSIDLPLSFENTKDYRLAHCTPPSCAFKATSATITFIKFDFTTQG